MMRILRSTCLLILLLSRTSTALSQSSSRVVAASATINDRYPKVSGVFRMSEGNIALGKLKKNSTARDTLWLWNADSVEHTFSAFSASRCLQLSTSGKPVAPRTGCWVAVAYEGSCNPGYGFFMERFTVKTDDPISPIKPFTATIRLEEYFPPMTSEDSLMAPRSRVSTTFCDFGKVRQGVVVNREIRISNDGKRDLLIRQAQSTQSNIRLKSSMDTIPPGTDATLTVELNTAGRSGRENSSFEVHLNDPFSPAIRIEVVYIVE